MNTFEPLPHRTNSAVRSARRRIRWSVAALLVMGISAGWLAWRGRQQYQGTLSLLNKHGRAEENFSWPWLSVHRAGIPVPRWFPQEIYFADNWDEEISEFLRAAGRCRTVRGLNLSGLELRDEHFLPLGRLTQLRELEISFADDFTGTGFRQLPRKNSVVKIVTETTGITDQGAAEPGPQPCVNCI